jgi:anaerobic magnesium-protoporphyrin IX monomethyl ester cyclase
VSYPLPGTKFHELVKAQLGSKTHWQDSNDLAMMFQGTYTSDFYRTIRDLLHDQVSLQNQHDESPILARQHRLKRSVERRWQELIAHERQHRLQGGGQSAAAV